LNSAAAKDTQLTACRADLTVRANSAAGAIQAPASGSMTVEQLLKPGSTLFENL